VNLSKEVSEPRTSTGSRHLSFLSGIFAQIFGQIVSIIRKRLRNTNLVASIYFQMKNTSLPVDVRCSKTPLLKFRVNLYPSGGKLSCLKGEGVLFEEACVQRGLI